MKKLRAIINRLENYQATPGQWIAGFIAVVLLRCFLEAIFEKPNNIMISRDFFESINAWFVHFPLFYLSIFLTLVLAIKISIPYKDTRKILKAVYLVFMFILSAPIFDLILTGGVGVDIGYMRNATLIPHLIIDSWDITQDFSQYGLSDGMRLELLLAGIMAILYVIASTKDMTARIIRTFAMFFMVFFIFEMYGFWPALLSHIIQKGFDFTPISDERGYQLMLKTFYETKFIRGNFANGSSLVYLWLIVIQGGIVLWSLKLTYFKDIFRSLRWWRFGHYFFLFVLGLVIGGYEWTDTVNKSVFPFTFFDGFGLLSLLLGYTFLFFATTIYNDIEDQDIDSLAHPERPLTSARIPERQYKIIAHSSLATALLLAYNVGYPTFLIFLTTFTCTHLYSIPPFRLRRFFLVSTAVLGLAASTVVLCGASFFLKHQAYELFPKDLLLIVFITFFFGANLKDLEDVQGDQAGGIQTAMTLFGNKGRAVIGGLVFTAFIIVGLFFMDWLLPLGIVMGIIVYYLIAIKKISTIKPAIYSYFAYFVAVISYYIVQM
ncbi:MAG: UbiA family prenyltransferase [Chlorobi bacterium]|nr:UbiA family prenyltransferase [Chlorobiota bacterium]